MIILSRKWLFDYYNKSSISITFCNISAHKDSSFQHSLLLFHKLHGIDSFELSSLCKTAPAASWKNGVGQNFSQMPSILKSSDSEFASLHDNCFSVDSARTSVTREKTNTQRERDREGADSSIIPFLSPNAICFNSLRTQHLFEWNLSPFLWMGRRWVLAFNWFRSQHPQHPWVLSRFFETVFLH